MAAIFDYHFEWDAAKAASNQHKHQINFDLAATVFRDPLMLSIPDEEHSETEERWLTMGQAENSKLYDSDPYLSGDQQQCGQCADHLCSACDQT